MKFAFPDVKVGSIIEYSYKLESDYIFNFRDWEFQSDIPTIYSEYESRMIPFYSYQFILKGASDFDEFDSYLDKSGIEKIFAGIKYYDMVYKYVMKDVPAFRPEEYISSRNDYLMQLDFQLSKINRPDGSEELIMTTWPELSNELIKHKAFGKFIKKAESGADKIINLESMQQMSDIDKITEVSNAVKNNFTWNNIYGKYANSTYKELLKNKTGNSGDINLLLIGVLRAAGIDAEPVILSTRNHGKVFIEYPFSSFLNYVVAYIKLNDRTIFIDATEPLSDYDLMPPRSINDRGLLIRKDEPEWVNISYSKPSREDIVIKTEFDTNPSSFNSKIGISADSYDALRIKNKFGNSITKVSDYYSSDQIKTINDSTIILNYDVSSEPLIINMYQTGSTEIINNKIYFSPFLEMVIKENPFKNTSRVYPIEMIYPYTETYNSSIVIPEGYVVDYLPEEVKYDNSLYGLEFYANEKDKTVEVYFSFTFKKGTYPSDNYLRLKNQFKMIVDCGMEKIVFKNAEASKE